MSVQIYEDVNFGGESHHLNPGNYTRTNIQNIHHGNFEKNISSIRVARNTIVLLSASSHNMGSNNRVLIGPQDVSDLGTLGFDDTTNSIIVHRFREDDWGAGTRATIFTGYNQTGSWKKLSAGEYDATRIASRENNQTGIQDGEIRSIIVEPNTIAVLYDGPSFENTQNAIFIMGPKHVELSRYSMDGVVSSIKVFAVDDPPSNLPTHTPTGLPPAQQSLQERRFADFSPGTFCIWRNSLQVATITQKRYAYCHFCDNTRW